MQAALETITKALMREQQARDQLEAALTEERAKVADLEAQLAGQTGPDPSDQ